MRTVLLVLALLLVGAPAIADRRQETDTAIAQLHAAEQALRTATATKAALSGRYEAELRTIDRLKKQRGSWRRDRQLRESLASSLETAKKLETATAEQRRAEARQDQARKRTLTAVAAELPAADASRVALLTRERDRLQPPPRTAKKIVMPELAIDPLADPEELEQQAAAIRESEAALATQVAMLDQRAARLDKTTELRRQHARNEALSEREEGQTRRGTFRNARSEGFGSDSGDGPPNEPAPGGGNGSGNPGPGNEPPTFPPTPLPEAPPANFGPSVSDAVALAESSTVLGDVIDAAALDSLRKAQGSTDPAVRAAAAKKARDAAAAKLDLLRKHRAAIEARARSLRK